MAHLTEYEITSEKQRREELWFQMLKFRKQQLTRVPLSAETIAPIKEIKR